MSIRRTLEQHLTGPGPKRILSLDGGGVRGLITLGMLKAIERELKAKYGDDCRVCDYFDLIGGTSTGALIATLLALGYDVDRIIAMYRKLIPEVFLKPRRFFGVRARFDTSLFEQAILRTLGDHLESVGRKRGEASGLTMETDLLQTGLALVTKRIDTGSPWVLTNNHRAKYWKRDAPIWKKHFEARAKLGQPATFLNNADFRLARMVQASASAPFYFDGVTIEIQPGSDGLFLDGAVSPYNNPSQALFLATTLRCYPGAGGTPNGWNEEGISPFGFNWQQGADKLMMLSLGTGGWRHNFRPAGFFNRLPVAQAIHAMTGLMRDTSVHADTWMQAISEPAHGHHIDGNLLDMCNLRIVDKPLLWFRRANPLLERAWLADNLGDAFELGDAEVNDLRSLTNPRPLNLKRLEAIGTAAGCKLIADTDVPDDNDLARLVQG